MMYSSPNSVPMSTARGYAGGYVSQPARPAYSANAFAPTAYASTTNTASSLARPVAPRLAKATFIQATPTAAIAQPKLVAPQASMKTAGEALSDVYVPLMQSISGQGLVPTTVKPLDPSRIRLKQLDDATPMDPVDYFFQTGFKFVMQEQLGVAKQISGVIADPLSQSDVQTIIENLKAEQMEKTAAVQCENIVALWEEYDRDKNGVLQPQELEKLLQDLWFLERKNLSVTTKAIMEQSMQFGLETALNSAKAQGANAEELKEVEMSMGMMTALMDMQMPLMEAASLKMMEQREANLASDVQQMLAAMDVNHDGVVTRDEFESKFLEAYQKISEEMKMPQGMPGMGAALGKPRPLEMPQSTVPKQQVPTFQSAVTVASAPKPAIVLPQSVYSGNSVMTATRAAPVASGMYGSPIGGAQFAPVASAPSAYTGNSVMTATRAAPVASGMYGSPIGGATFALGASGMYGSPVGGAQFAYRR